MVELSTYINIIHPGKFKETIARESKIENFNGAVANALIIGIISIITSFYFNYLITFKTGIYASASTAYMPTFSPLSVIISFLFVEIFFFLSPFLLNVIARYLGGKGTYGKLLWPFSILAVSYSIIMLPFLAIYPLSIILVCLSGLVLIPFEIYNIYLQYKILRAVHHSLTRGRAIAAFLIQWFILLVFGCTYLFFVFYTRL